MCLSQLKCVNFKSFVNLECLKLQQLFLTGTSFQGLFRLERLELYECDFESFKSESFRHVTNLKGLSIVNPKNAENLNFQELSKLKWLHLADF